MEKYNIKTGAREAVERMCEVYGFTSRLQLANYLEISPSALGTRIMRDNFPADLVLRCALETGASIYWLTTGEGSIFNHLASDTVRIPAYKISGTEFIRHSSYIYDKATLPDHEGELQTIKDGDKTYFVDVGAFPASDGKFLIEYSQTKSIKDLTILPGNKLRIDWKYPVDCDISDVKIIGKIVALYMVI
jgi:hypothetical protein